MLRRTEPVVSLVPRFGSRVQSKGAAASTSWTRRFASKPADAAIGSSRSVPHVIEAMRIARRRVERRRVAIPPVPRASGIAAAPKGVWIIAITSGPIAPA